MSARPLDKTEKKHIIKEEEHCRYKRLALLDQENVSLSPGINRHKVETELMLSKKPSLGRVAVFAFFDDDGNGKDTDIKRPTHQLHTLSVVLPAAYPFWQCSPPIGGILRFKPKSPICQHNFPQKAESRSEF